MLALRHGTGGVVSEPVADPPPAPEPYSWKTARDMNCDVLALVVCGVLADYGAATSIVATLDRDQLVSVLWCVVRWYGDSLAQDFEDPVEMLRGLALVLAKGRGEAA